MACLFSSLCLPQLAHAGWFSHSDIPTVPPALNFKWNVGQKNSRIEQVFLVEEYRSYDFNIGFGSPIAWNDKTHQEWRKDERVWSFIGRGGFVGFANPDGVLIPIMDKTGVLIRVTDTRGDVGVMIPVHLQIERLGETGTTIATLADVRVNTYSLAAGGDVVTRSIATVKLRRGKYRVIANTLRDTMLPDGIGTYLNIDLFHAKSTPPF